VTEPIRKQKPHVLRSCPFCQSNDVLTIVDLGTVYYACGGCKRYFTPKDLVRKEEGLKRLEVPVARRAPEAEFKVLEKTMNKAVFQFINYLVAVEKTSKGFETQIFDGEKEALTPVLSFSHIDQLFGRKGAPLRQVIRDRDLFMNFAIALQRTLAELSLPEGEEPSEEAPATEKEAEGPQLEFKGGIIEDMDLVYEPLGHGLYAWKIGDKKGINKMMAVYRQDERRRARKKPVLWKIKIDENEYYFKKEPSHVAKSFLGALPFHVPQLSFLEKWVNGEIKSKTGKELFHEAETYVRRVLDLEEIYNAKTLALYIFQSWLRNIVKVMFNIDVGGPFGGGKTTALEATAEVCYHSLLGSASAAAIARMNEKYALSWALDEYDKQRSWLSDCFIRVGYRWGSTVYRIHAKSGREEGFKPFGPKLISYYESLESALAQRSLDHIKITKSLDYHLPIINWARETLSKPLFHSLFIWYMDNAVNLKKRTREEWPELEEFMEKVTEMPESDEFLGSTSQKMENAHVCVVSKKREELSKNPAFSVISDTKEEEIKRFRESFYQKIVEKLSIDERSFIESLSDRPCELAFSAINIARLLGVDVIKDLKEALEIKILEEQEEEFDVDVIVKEVLTDMQVKELILQKDAYQEAKKRVKEAYGDVLSPHKFKRVLRDLGFREKKTIIRRKQGRFLVLSPAIRKKLPKREIVEGVPQPLSVTVMAKCEECFKHKLLTHYIILEGKKYNLCRECAEAK